MDLVVYIFRQRTAVQGRIISVRPCQQSDVVPDDNDEQGHSPTVFSTFYTNFGHGVICGPCSAGCYSK